MPKENYWGSVLFYKHLILAVIAVMIVVPTTISIVLAAKYTSLKREVGELSGQLAEVSAQAEESSAAQPVVWTEDLSYQQMYPDLYSLETGDPIYEKNTIYLTFDDGPSTECTPQILDILREYDVKATFFVVGANNNTPEKVELLKRIVAEGHTLGIHSYSHDYNRIYTSVEAYLDDFNQMYEWIYQSTGVKPEIFRFPGGSINGYDKKISREIITEMTRRGFQYFDWNMSANDAVNGGISAEAIADNILTQSQNVVRGVVLLHDSYDKQSTVDALPEIITGLRERGFTFAPLTKEVTSVKFKYTN